ncbi:alpha/beta hydrolase [Nonomuraea sp. NN258]|uniref:alpha/beta fold hydrolase n=1 Tax=Nonomuraea antri TaxID=2730852 RepID=UPI0015697ABF|nr:alpha/beta hydrolase [Nonomuraea antri]NRQ35812.1 alpha/beta hydrolase [Nonomuraea antri]
MRSLSVSRSTVSYRREGHGRGLVLLHGSGSDGQSAFGHLIGRFTDIRTVITPDYGGSGQSTLLPGPISLELLVEQAAAVIRDATDGPVDLLGCSLGAVVASATAARHPELVHRLVLIAGWADSDDPRHQMLFETWKRLEALDGELSTRFGLSLAFSPDFLSGLGHDRVAELAAARPASGLDRRLDLGLRIDTRALLRAIGAPTLVVGLTQDYLVPVHRVRVVHKSIPGSQYTEIDSGHAVTLEKPDELVHLIRTFLDD